jgi:hypothetical protein
MHFITSGALYMSSVGKQETEKLYICILGSSHRNGYLDVFSDTAQRDYDCFCNSLSAINAHRGQHDKKKSKDQKCVYSK